MRDSVKQKKNLKKLANLLQARLEFESSYANWVANNLYRLDPASRNYLTSLGAGSKYRVQLAIVTDTSEGNVKVFEFVAKTCAGSGMLLYRYVMLEKAIERTNTKHIKLTINQIKQVVDFVLANEITV